MVTEQPDALSARDITDLRRQRDAWRKLALARGRILVGYRIGRTPGGAIDDANNASRALVRLGIDPDTGKGRKETGELSLHFCAGCVASFQRWLVTEGPSVD